MTQIRVPGAPYPPDQAVFVRAVLSTSNEFDNDKPLTSADAHKVTAMPHSIAFFDEASTSQSHDGAMPVSVCGSQYKLAAQPLGIICDPVLDGSGVLRHPKELGSVSCGVRGSFTIAVDDGDLRDASIGDNLYIKSTQDKPISVFGSVENYRALEVAHKDPYANPGTNVPPGVSPDGLIGRIVGFGHNEVRVCLA